MRSRFLGVGTDADDFQCGVIGAPLQGRCTCRPRADGKATTSRRCVPHSLWPISTLAASGMARVQVP